MINKIKCFFGVHNKIKTDNNPDHQVWNCKHCDWFLIKGKYFILDPKDNAEG